MSRIANPLLYAHFSRFAVTFLAAAGLALAQEQAPPPPPGPAATPQASPNGAWRRVGDPVPAQTPAPAPIPATAPDPAAAPAAAPAPQPPPTQDPSQPVAPTDAYGQPIQAAPQDVPPPPQDAPPPPQSMPPGAAPQNRPAYGLPAEVTLQPGAYVTVRTNQMLSSDHNQPGDTFSATLIQPLVVSGIVVAQRGQIVYGRVADAQKAHSDKPSRLVLELTGLTLSDGAQVSVKSQLVNRQGGTTPAGVQAGTVAGTTAVGAAVGAAAGWGTGAAIGAGAGMIVGVAGVLLTRNHPTLVYPETALTFRIDTPVTIATGSNPQAFHFVGPNEYQQRGVPTLQPRPPVAPGYPGYYGGAYAAPYGYGYPYPYPYYGYSYPYYYPYSYEGFGVVIGPRFGRFGRRW